MWSKKHQVTNVESQMLSCKCQIIMISYKDKYNAKLLMLSYNVKLQGQAINVQLQMSIYKCQVTGSSYKCPITNVNLQMSSY